MKPSRLTMQAFSTYLDPVTIDFTKLNEKGLYLISGETGAGKTTIFDAICYALYGETSGSSRSNDVFRSDFAPLDMPTIVELDFILHERHYIVHREFSFRASGKRRPDQDYFKNGETVVTGRRDVNLAIKNLMGVDARQFKQIVMIAQGEFTRLLHASSDERVKIFRDIFHTQHIMDFEASISRLAKGYETRYQESMTTLNTMLSGMHLDVGDAFSQETLDLIAAEIVSQRDQAKKERSAIKKRNEELEKMTSRYYQLDHLNKDIDRYHQYAAEKEALAAKRDAIVQRERDITAITKAVNVAQIENGYRAQVRVYDDLTRRLEDLHQQHEVLAQQRVTLNAQLSLREEKQKRLEQLKSEIATLEETLTLKKSYEEKQAAKEALQEKADALAQRISEAAAKRERRARHYERDGEAIAMLPEHYKQMSLLDEKMTKLLTRRNQLHDFSDLYDAYYLEQEKQYEITANFRKIRRDYMSAEMRYGEEYDRYMSDQAGILAADLMEGMPCPVCGSRHHPNKAQMHDKTLTASEIAALKQETERLKAEADSWSQRFIEQQNKKHHIKEQMDALQEELDIHEEITKQIFVHLLSDVVREEEHDHEVYAQHQEEVTYLEKLSKSHARDQKKLAQCDEELTAMREELAGYQTRIAALEGMMQTIAAQRDFSHADEQDIAGMKHETVQLTSWIERTAREEAHLNREETINETQIDDTMKSQRKQIVVVQEHHDAYLAEMLAAFPDEDAYRRYLAQENKRDIYQQEVSTYYQKVHTAESQLAELAAVKDQPKTDLTSLMQEIDTYRDEKKAQDDASYAFIHRYGDLKETYHKIKALATQNEELFTTYERYHHLNQITNGKNDHKLSFERYVLASYFEQILDFANIELDQLTQGRFQFLRRKEVKGNAHQGLDLNILDFETGVSRDVKSLSGGESFKASLALALGLSEMIQSYAGGIELNALFIDEGFGSLDDESLDQAINVLLEMKSNDKVISIISHVNELKNRIDEGIIVNRGVHGSTMKFMN